MKTSINTKQATDEATPYLLNTSRMRSWVTIKRSMVFIWYTYGLHTYFMYIWM